MTVGQFSDEIALVLELIRENGELSTISRRTDGTPGDADKPWDVSAPTATTYTAYAVWLNFESSRIDGDTIKRGDRDVWIPASGLSITPDQNTDVITRVDGSVWTIVQVDTIQPNEDTIVYRLQLRQ